MMITILGGAALSRSLTLSVSESVYWAICLSVCYVLPLLSAVRKWSVFFSKNWRFLLYPSGVPVWAQMADDETLRALCTLRKKKNQMSQRTMRKTRWAGSTLASAWWSSKESATCPLIWEGKKNKRWMVSGYVIIIWSLIIIVLFCLFKLVMNL